MSISPPPLKRRRVANARQAQEAAQDLIGIYSWNVNGIDPLIQVRIEDFFRPKDHDEPRNEQRTTPLLRFLERHNYPALLFFQEVKIRPDDQSTIQAIRVAVSPPDRPKNHQYEAHFCLPTTTRHGKAFRGKIYGVCSLIRRDFAQSNVARVRNVDWDAEGRFLVVETQQTQSIPRLAIFNVYMVNGTDLPYKDEKTGQIQGTRHDRKLEVHRLLQSECRRLQEDGYAVIIAGDINIARSRLDGHPNLRTSPRQHVLNRMDFEHRFMHSDADGAADRVHLPDAASLAMVDTFRHLHPDRKGYSYYSRSCEFGMSCDRVDMILASRTIGDCCSEAGLFETKADRATSDHVPIFARFDFANYKSKSTGAN